MTGALAIVVGFVLGLRHATDADHVVALATLLRRERGVRGAVILGAMWGAGHTVVVLAVGVAIVLLRLEIPPALDRYAEIGVALMLVGLGLRHLLPRRHPHGEAAMPAFALRPFAIGMVHGLAGSAGVTLIALTTIRVPSIAMLYLLLFGAGTVGGMMALTAALSLPLVYAGRSPRVEPWIVRGASVASVVLGIVLGVRTLMA